ncbi:MAG: diacylglycerol kinase family protein [Clostridia bacterium]|nr:diacylglycerol kinase family protein [Clostridia bacterium]
MKTYILYNRLAGHGDSEAASKALAAKFKGEVTCRDITEITDYKALFSGLDAEDTLVVCGGDGTLNRFANAIASLSCSCKLLYYAVGTGNDFLKDIGREKGSEPVSIKPYLENLPEVEVNGERYLFLNGVGYGIDGYCCEVGDKQKATSDKPVNYTSIAIKGLLFHYKPKNAVVTVDGKEYRYKKVWIAATMKGRYYGGGMMNAPLQDRLSESGEVSLVMFYGKGKLKTLIAFPSIFKGEHVKKTNMVAVHTGKRITVRFEKPAPLQIDGETVLNVREYTVTAKAKAPVKVAENAAV